MAVRILVADDSSPIQKVIRITLSKFPYEITCVSSFLEATQEISKQRPDVVIFDVGLPGMNQLADFRQQTLNKNIPVIALLGSYERFTDADLANEGFQSFLKKPFEAAELIQKVQGFVGSKSSVEAEPAFVPPPPPQFKLNSNPGKPVFSESLAEEKTIIKKPSFEPVTKMPAFEPPVGGSDEQIRSAVEEYCQKNFKNIAREILTQELRRLAEEKARLLVDN